MFEFNQQNLFSVKFAVRAVVGKPVSRSIFYKLLLRFLNSKHLDFQLLSLNCLFFVSFFILAP